MLKKGSTLLGPRMRSEIILKDNKKRPFEDKMDTFTEKSFLANIKRDKRPLGNPLLYIYKFLGAFRRLGFRILKKGIV